MIVAANEVTNIHMCEATNGDDRSAHARAHDMSSDHQSLTTNLPNHEAPPPLSSKWKWLHQQLVPVGAEVLQRPAEGSGELLLEAEQHEAEQHEAEQHEADCLRGHQEEFHPPSIHRTQ